MTRNEWNRKLLQLAAHYVKYGEESSTGDEPNEDEWFEMFMVHCEQVIPPEELDLDVQEVCREIFNPDLN